VAPSAGRLSKRMFKNVEYFQSNYVLVFLGKFETLHNFDRDWVCYGTLPLLLRIFKLIFRKIEVTLLEIELIVRKNKKETLLKTILIGF
jgi:hypothetical protein